MVKIPIGLQMFTLRDEAGKDFAGTLKAVSEIGYDGVELAGDGGLSAKELKKLLDDLGLACAGAHEGLEKLETSLNAVVDFHKELNSKFIAIPFLGEERRKGAEGWKKTAGIMTEIGHKLREEGLQLCYHNHAFEFEKFDGQYALDILYENTDAEAVQAELDTYWVKYGGEDPIEYIEKLEHRVPLIHLKDMAATEDRTFAEVGEGTLDIQGIFNAAEKAHARWMIVEQDSCKRPPLESVKISLDNLKKMGLA
ncbi:MAG: sugar phosphate isomerase/epimerase [Armatimonadetes bacterium]|nr:sugar phosphate isomerase/epimerase [Armatimonadota bacterium]